MAEPPVNNELPPPREDGHTASDSESNNGRGSGARQAAAVRRPSPRREATREVSPRRTTSRVPTPRRRLDRLESNYARQREVEEQLRQEKAWRKETEEKLK
ncbi:hypothetical protein PIB30_061243 [Stylosanthes scabra]|uniref:Uncharacterized protein n=1 Tax=Stylosanthes scabra TaxID=79078 RepID=A0ABU6VJ70_9FABA|nr:hypothetical protein [Stylosanthes scabra]